MHTSETQLLMRAVRPGLRSAESTLLLFIGISLCVQEAQRVLGSVCALLRSESNIVQHNNTDTPSLTSLRPRGCPTWPHDRRPFILPSGLWSAPMWAMEPRGRSVLDALRALP